MAEYLGALKSMAKASSVDAAAIPELQLIRRNLRGKIFSMGPMKIFLILSRGSRVKRRPQESDVGNYKQPGVNKSRSS